jgi:hypothetical protein
MHSRQIITISIFVSSPAPSTSNQAFQVDVDASPLENTPKLEASKLYVSEDVHTNSGIQPSSSGTRFDFEA